MEGKWSSPTSTLGTEEFVKFLGGPVAQWGPDLEPSFHYLKQTGGRGTTVEGSCEVHLGGWRWRDRGVSDEAPLEQSFFFLGNYALGNIFKCAATGGQHLHS